MLLVYDKSRFLVTWLKMFDRAMQHKTHNEVVQDLPGFHFIQQQYMYFPKNTMLMMCGFVSFQSCLGRMNIYIFQLSRDHSAQTALLQKDIICDSYIFNLIFATFSTHYYCYLAFHLFILFEVLRPFQLYIAHVKHGQLTYSLSLDRF